jgi:hypothetical protein
MQSLALAKRKGNPFFIMAGFRRPHRVFYVHKRFWDLYPGETAYDASAISVAKVQMRDPSQPEIAFHHGDFTLANGSYWPGNADLPWPLEVQRIARKGYYAAVTQTDFCVGECSRRRRRRRRPYQCSSRPTQRLVDRWSCACCLRRASAGRAPTAGAGAEHHRAGPRRPRLAAGGAGGGSAFPLDPSFSRSS